MPAIYKTVYPRVRRYLKKEGLLKTAWRCLGGPYQFIQEYSRSLHDYSGPAVAHPFDVAHGVETSTRVHSSDLQIDSPNRICAGGYWPTPPELFKEALSKVTLPYQEFMFIDFGSGKGRVLLLASDCPFRRIVGIEFSHELHVQAQENIRDYKSETQKCSDITSLCMDFTEFELPDEPLVLFFYNPASTEVMTAVAANIARSLAQSDRPIFVIYITPVYNVFESGNPVLLRKMDGCTEKYSLYTNTAIDWPPAAAIEVSAHNRPK